MEKGIEEEENNLYKETDGLADNVTSKLSNISSNIDLGNGSSGSNINIGIDYEKMSNAILKALTGCKFTLEEDGIARIVKDELYKVV